MAVQQNPITKDEDKPGKTKKFIAASALKLKKCVPEKDILADEPVHTSSPRTVLKLELNHNKDFIRKQICMIVDVDFAKHQKKQTFHAKFCCFLNLWQTRIAGDLMIDVYSDTLFVF